MDCDAAADIIYFDQTVGDLVTDTHVSWWSGDVIGGGVDAGNRNLYLNAGDGSDTLVVYQYEEPGSAIQIGDGLIILGTVVTVQEVESVVVATYGFDDAITVFANPWNLTINAGAGDDTVTLRNVANYSRFPDGVRITDAILPLSIDGGDGVNHLIVDDAESAVSGYQLRPRHFRSNANILVSGFDFTFQNFPDVALIANNRPNDVQIFGTSRVSPEFQYTVDLRGGDDTVSIQPRNADGSPSILANIGIVGGAGTDSITIDDSASATGADWVINNPFGPATQDFSVAGGQLIGALSDVENVAVHGSQSLDTFRRDIHGRIPLSIHGGNGDDTFILDRYRNGGSLNVQAGMGNDTFNVTPTSNRLTDIYGMGPRRGSGR